MASLFDALFRGLRGEITPVNKESKESYNPRAPLFPSNPVATRSDTGAEDNEDVLDITVLSIDPTDELPIVLSHIRSGETNSSFDTTSTIDDMTVSTPGVEVSFGPQGTPYVIRRRPPLGGCDRSETPSMAPHNTLESNLYRPPPRRTAAVSIRHPDGSLDEVERVIDPVLPATTWRQEQVKYVRKARLNPNFKPKNIPTLHGPPSLPYARNPSGVDAIIIEDSACPSPAYNHRAGPAAKPTLHSFMHAPAANLPASQPEPLPSRPLIIRTAGDILALQQPFATKTENSKSACPHATATASLPKPRLADPQPAAADFISISNATAPSSLPASMILKSQGKNVRSRDPDAKSKLSASDPFDGLFDQALVSAAKQSDSTEVETTPGGPAAEHGFTPSYADLKAIWAAATEHYSRKAAAPSDESMPSEASKEASFGSVGSKDVSFPPGTYSTPVRIPALSVVSSKADKSANWRDKGMATTTPGGREIPAIAVTSPSAADGNSSTMTIDSLFQKFSNLEDKVPVTATRGSKSVDPAIKETSDTPMKPTKTIQPAQPIRRPLGEAKPSILNPALKKTQSVGTKGTPNAGKLLKKKVEIIETSQTSATGKEKQKAE